MPGPSPLEELEQRILELEQGPSTSVSEAVGDSGDECCEAAGPHLAASPVVQQVGSVSSLWPGGTSSRGSQCAWVHDASTIYSVVCQLE